MASKREPRTPSQRRSGNQSKYTPAVAQQARALAAHGIVTDEALGQVFGVYKLTFHTWRTKYPELEAAIAAGRDDAMRDAGELAQQIAKEQDMGGLESIQLLRRVVSGDEAEADQITAAKALLTTLPRRVATDITSGGEQLTITPLGVKFVDAAGNEVTVDDEVGV